MATSSQNLGGSVIPTTDESPSVVVVEDQELMSKSLVEVLRMEGFAADAVFPDSIASLFSMLRRHPPDVVLLDLELGRLGDGADLVEAIIDIGPAVVVLTGIGDELRHAACLEGGASGVIAKDADLATLLRAVRTAGRGRSLVSAPERRRLLERLEVHRSRVRRRLAAFESLTKREEDVLVSMRRGMSVAVIAEELHIAPSTVRSHVRHILTKLGATSQLEAVSLARELDRLA